MEKLNIKCFKGVNDILFEMSPKDVALQMGEPDKCEEHISRMEIRGEASYIYENDKLISISGELTVPFMLNGERIPPTGIEAAMFLKRKSQINMRFTNITSYIFADLGIVLYPHTVSDIRAGIKATSISPRIAICNNTVLKRYYQYFLKKQEESGNGFDSKLIEQIGRFIEEELR